MKRFEKCKIRQQYLRKFNFKDKLQINIKFTKLKSLFRTKNIFHDQNVSDTIKKRTDIII